MGTRSKESKKGLSGASARTIAFYVLLSLPILGWLVLFSVCYFISTQSSADFLAKILWVAPIVAKDFSFLGEITPAVLAGLVIALSSSDPLVPSAPDENALSRIWNNLRVETIIAVAITLVSYALYVHLTYLFSDRGEGYRVMSYYYSGAELTGHQKTVLNLISLIKTTIVVLFASIVGLKAQKTSAGS